MQPLTQADRQQIQEKGLTAEAVTQQLETFNTGIPYTTLDRPCTVGDGITRLSTIDLEHYAHTFHQAMDSGRVTKFVPASGAATRMFKILLTALEETSNKNSQASFQELLSREKESGALENFFHQVKSFAFFNELRTKLGEQGIQGKNKQYTQHWRAVLRSLLHSPGLHYANLPKALLAFHRYPDHVRTPMEEHIHEGIAYAKDATGTVRLHFTISAEHEQLMREHLTKIQTRHTKQDIQLLLTFSHQAPSTETIAVELNNRLFRDTSGKLVFRPGGHGALLNNLTNLQGDIVFIKNIDNVVPERLVDQPNLYKKAIGGYLLTVQQQLFTYLNMLSQKQTSIDILQEMFNFASKTLGITIPASLQSQSIEQQQQFCINQFNRPLRVCGMVVNEGEPGGGPFWVTHQDGTCSRQIVESSQVDSGIEQQKSILKSSTHFNPVDLVCAMKDFKGNAFDLPRYSDPKTGFISIKSYQGRELKALELPGLWNGAMAFWNTLFIEVPASTFNPVKTIFDLLRPEHQPQ